MLPIIFGYQFRSLEVKQTAFHIDGVFLPPEDFPNLPVYFVEVQFQDDAELYHRLFTEIFIFLRQNPEIANWQATVIFPRPSLEPPNPLALRELLSSPRCQRFYLCDFRSQDNAAIELELLSLIVENKRRIAPRAKNLINRSQSEGTTIPPQVIIELIYLILTSKFSELSREEIIAMLDLPVNDLKQTRAYQETWEEGSEARAIEIARELLQSGMPIEQVARFTKLSVERLQELSSQG